MSMTLTLDISLHKIADFFNKMSKQ